MKSIIWVVLACVLFGGGLPVSAEAVGLIASDYDIIAYLSGEGADSQVPLSAELGIKINSDNMTTWTLLNTSPEDSYNGTLPGADSGSGVGNPPRIDALFFQLDGFPPLTASNLDMSILNDESDVDSNWFLEDFSGSSGGAGKFSLTQSETDADYRLGIGKKLVFSLNTEAFAWTPDIFLNALGSEQGKTLTDFQVAASFQTVYDGEDSGVAGGKYSTIPPNPVPEPATILLIGTGLAGLAGAQRFRKKQ